MTKPNYNSNQDDLDLIDEQEDLELHKSDSVENFIVLSRD